MGYMVKPGDVVNFDGAVLPWEKVYILLNKPNLQLHLTKVKNLQCFRIGKGSTTAKIEL
jgi:23S rRNA pseudouridine2605 synthase